MNFYLYLCAFHQLILRRYSDSASLGTLVAHCTRHTAHFMPKANYNKNNKKPIKKVSDFGVDYCVTDT